MRHPEHDRLREEVRSWYRTSLPELGYHVERRRFGSYRRHAEDPDSGLIIVDALAPDEVPEFLADATSYFDSRAVNIWLDDKELDATLGRRWLRLELPRTRKILTSRMSDRVLSDSSDRI